MLKLTNSLIIRLPRCVNELQVNSTYAGVLHLRSSNAYSTVAQILVYLTQANIQGSGECMSGVDVG